jgi:hypothetical protein
MPITMTAARRRRHSDQLVAESCAAQPPVHEAGRRPDFRSSAAVRTGLATARRLTGTKRRAFIPEGHVDCQRLRKGRAQK